MSEQKPTVVLVHGAFAESASWNPVIERLQARGSRGRRRRQPVAQRHGRRGLRARRDRRDRRAGRARRALLRRHGDHRGRGRNDAVRRSGVRGRVRARPRRVGARRCRPSSPAAPSATPSAPTRCRPAGTSSPSGRRSSTTSSPPTSPLPQAALMGATQRPVTEAALSEGLPDGRAGVEAHPVVVRVRRPGPERPGRVAALHGPARGRRGHGEVAGASHAVSVSNPDSVTATIVAAVAAVSRCRCFGVAHRGRPLPRSGNGQPRGACRAAVREEHRMSWFGPTRREVGTPSRENVAYIRVRVIGAPTKGCCVTVSLPDGTAVQVARTTSSLRHRPSRFAGAAVLRSVVRGHHHARGSSKASAVGDRARTRDRCRPTCARCTRSIRIATQRSPRSCAACSSKRCCT